AYRADVVSSQLAFFDRTGKELGLIGPVSDYSNPTLSPDGKYVAFQRGSPPDIWVVDILRGVASRLTTDPAADSFPIWSPDGRSIVFTSSREGPGNLYTRAFGIVGADKLLLKTEPLKIPDDWSRDYVVMDVRSTPAGGARDIWALPTSGDSEPLRVTESP